MPIGVLTNCAAVLAGGALGAGLGKLLPEDLKDNLPTLFGLCSIGIGINSVIKVSGMTAAGPAGGLYHRPPAASGILDGQILPQAGQDAAPGRR